MDKMETPDQGEGHEGQHTNIEKVVEVGGTENGHVPESSQAPASPPASPQEASPQPLPETKSATAPIEASSPTKPQEARREEVRQQEPASAPPIVPESPESPAGKQQQQQQQQPQPASDDASLSASNAPPFPTPDSPSPASQQQQQQQQQLEGTSNLTPSQEVTPKDEQEPGRLTAEEEESLSVKKAKVRVFSMQNCPSSCVGSEEACERPKEVMDVQRCWDLLAKTRSHQTRPCEHGYIPAVLCCTFAHLPSVVFPSRHHSP
jgi:hypothetical protein